eukprot:m.10308 g.10308  ORF g.10308 m.10308 type:complete len:298 (-) comp4299_c0_seq1:127-1020(-)
MAAKDTHKAAGSAAQPNMMKEQDRTDMLLGAWSVSWIGMVGAVVASENWRQWDGMDYIYFGVTLAVPCIALPLGADLQLSSGDYLSWWSVRSNVWIATVVVLASHFGTQYFYALLGVRYTLPTAGWELNNVPLSMHLMAHPYFITYHTLAVKVIQWVDPEYPKAPQFPMRMRQLGLLWLMGYATAYVEAWSISSFPHYSYPDREAMMTVGSAFYSLLFVVTYPMYVELHRSHAAEEKCSIWQVFCHALAASMIVLVLYETWRLSIGRISPLVDDTLCPPYTHSILGHPDSVSVVSRP